MKYYLILSYDGTDFCGWQRQRQDNSIQQKIEEAAEKVFGTVVKITASGRTDAGVHAVGQVCSFSVETKIPAPKIADCLNMQLPCAIRVLKSGYVPDDFDACRTAKQKTYCYSCYLSDRENPLKERYSLRIGEKLDWEEMKKAAKLLEGEHDFKAFCASGSSAKTTIRTIYSIELNRTESLGSENLKIFVCGNGFLYNMVRTMSGTILEVGRGRIKLDSITKALETGARNLVGKTLSAKGLMLMNVEYFTKLS